MNETNVENWAKSTSDQIISFLGSNITLFVTWGLAPLDSIDTLQDAFFYEFSNGKKDFTIVLFEMGCCELPIAPVISESKMVLEIHCIDDKQVNIIDNLLKQNLKSYLKSVEYGYYDN